MFFPRCTLGQELRDWLTAGVSRSLWLLLGAVGFVLLVACANVANLLLVRATARSREMAIRAALGGSRRRLIGQVFVESVVLALVGGAVGVVLAQIGIQALVALQPADLPRLESVSLNPSVLGFALMASLGSALIFGVFPAFGAFGDRLHESLRGRSVAGASSWQHKARNGMVILEVAFS